MKSIGKAFAATVLLVVAGCSGDSPPPTSGDTSKPAYFVLDDSLSRLQADFNAMIDKVRLVFISGPSCGICLRGMDDLNRSIVQSVQNDPRIHTFVLYVPTLEAGEKHAVAATPLMTGPRVSHYWDPGGNSGLEFQTALDISGYAWDVWMIYEPGARWQEGHSPPAPVYWEHQLPFLPKAQRLDAARFATQVRQRLAVLPAAGETAVIAESRRSDPQIMAVMQPRGVMIKQNHLSRGGYQNIKRITAIRYRGETEVGDRTYPLTVETQRPNSYKRTVINNGSLSILVWDGVETVREGKQKWLPETVQNEILVSYDFDGWMTDFKDKGHQVHRLGMKKTGARLPWLMEAALANGRTWRIYVDSHSGDAFRTALIDTDGRETITLEYSDYRVADGFRLPHQIRYFENGRLLVTDRFAEIAVTTTAAVDDPTTQPVTVTAN